MQRDYQYGIFELFNQICIDSIYQIFIFFATESVKNNRRYSLDEYQIETKIKTWLRHCPSKHREEDEEGQEDC